MRFIYNSQKQVPVQLDIGLQPHKIRTWHRTPWKSDEEREVVEEMKMFHDLSLGP